MTILNIFGASSPPGAYALYEDGSPSITLAHRFYRYGGLIPDAATIVGGRVWIPSVPPGAPQLRLMLWLDGDMTTTPTREALVPVTGTGWQEGTFSTPAAIPAEGVAFRVGYQFTSNDDTYIHTPGLRADATGLALVASPENGLALSEEKGSLRLGTGPEGTATGYNVGYGIDVLIDDAAAGGGNIAPTVDAGANRSIYLGQSTTLTAVASDADGTVASYDWFQTSGPTATLDGSGAIRTFTPTVTGSYVFTAIATDDEGATSTPDSVTITVLAVPVTPTPTEGTAQPVAKIGSIERALMALLVRDLEVLGGVDTRIGGGFPREVDDFYVRIDRVPGGRATSFEGDFVVDIEVFSEDYLRAEDISEDIEVLLLAHGYHTVVSGGKKWILDGVFQNTAITDIPWASDDDTHRLMATYAFTVRRGGS